MESLHPFRISIKTGPDPQYGYLINPDRNLHILMTEISRRAIAIMRTNRAKGALRQLAERWSEEHKKSLFPDAAVSGFQCLLANADMDAIKWPLVVMDFTMEGTRSAQFVYPTVSMMDSNAPYPVQRDSFHLDGVRVHGLAQDIARNSPERHVRMLELVWAYIHEIGHFYICYLNFVIKNRTDRLPSPKFPNNYGSDTREAGWTLERLVFGGCHYRESDGCWRKHRFQPGLPILDTRTSGIRGIPLSDVERIATKDLRRLNPYTDDDLTIRSVALDQTQAQPEKRFPSFYQEFRTKYQRGYSALIPFNDTETVPLEFTLQMSKVVAGVENTRTVTRSRTVMLGENKLQPRHQHQPGLKGLSSKPIRPSHALTKPTNVYGKKRNAPETLRADAHDSPGVSQKSVNSRPNHGNPQQKPNKSRDGIT